MDWIILNTLICCTLVTGLYPEAHCPLHCSCEKNSINCSNKSLLTFSDFPSGIDFYDLINLSGNNLNWLPPISAKTVDISSNLFQDFPLLIPPIQVLILKKNTIKLIESHDCPPSLKYLDLSENPIKHINLTCDGLKNINLAYGDIDTLPDKFLSNFKSLKTLNLDNNPLKRILGDLSSGSLEVVSLQRTQLRYVKPTLFTNLSRVKVINLSGNKYIHALSLMTGVELLLANQCALETVDLSGMPRLKGVEISDNHLKTLLLPDSVRELKARNNLLYSIDLQQLKKADLSGNYLMSLHLKPMEFLNISRNPITHLGLVSINHLDASQCSISSVDYLGARFNTLNLSRNNLETFPGHVIARKLDLSFNRLNTFKTEIEGVEEIWLMGNRFVLAEDVTGQGIMHLYDNPWTCDCKMDHLYTKAYDENLLTCAHPKNVSGQTWSSACYKSRIPKWIMARPYIPFAISTIVLLAAMFFFYWLRAKLDIPPELFDEEEQTAIGASTVPSSQQVRINNQLPSYEEALLMPGIVRKKNALTQTRSYEVLSRRLSSNSI